MRTVALETSHTTGTIALLEDAQVVADVALDPDRRTAQTLISGLHQILDQYGWKPQQVDLVAVAAGPGSFTGLRIGVTAAKTLAYAVAAQILSIHTLRAIAAATPAEFQTVSAAIDAQRQRVFAARFVRGEQGWYETQPTVVLPIDVWLAGLTPDEAVTGPVLAECRARIPASTAVVDPDLWLPRAAWVGRLAVTDFAAGRREDLWQVVPHYYQKSAAEEKWDDRAREAN
ncbi:MAG: tRNA (adenosine(37)-N6)-threonylcarbamoyltransferase complex dimerization subunit type 1 TsaB [Planctomycetales bacterium]|nr:tRNA (adenosine(37)-N6)-threonylcarbamoyltransferase complex dimerization subunit type 1 TsaB [Planctomycetales bacterium]